MAPLEIVIYPEEVLRTPAEPVDEITPEIVSLLDRMVETMYDAPGIGLAAPQVGVSKRLIVVHVGEDDDSLYKLINPRIIATGETVLSEEGCLSLPGIRESIFRYNEVTVVAQTVDGEEITIEAEGLLAFCFQHEIDHLDGVLFIDHLSKLKKKLVAAKLKKLRREK